MVSETRTAPPHSPKLASLSSDIAAAAAALSAELRERFAKVWRDELAEPLGVEDYAALEAELSA